MPRISGRLGMIGVALGVFLSSLTAPVQAQFTLYDEFPPGAIDPTKWRPDLVTSRQVYEVRRQITPEGQLVKGVRIYGGTEQDTGVVMSRNGLSFNRDAAAIRFDATVLNYQLTGCAVPGSAPSEVRLESHAIFFNDGTDPGGPSSNSGDVIAEVWIARRSDSPQPPEVLEVTGTVRRCGDPECTLRDELGTVALGQALLGQANTYLLLWDIFGNRIVFQKNADPIVAVPLSVPVGTRRTRRELVTRSIAANCTVSPQPVAEVNAAYDNVLVIIF